MNLCATKNVFVHFLNLMLLVVLITGCINENSKQKSSCGCEQSPKKKKRLYCERATDYNDVFLNANFQGVVTIQLSLSNLPVISKTFFPIETASSFKAVEDLLLGENNIEYISTGAFKLFENLKKLNLSYNKIGKLHQGMFDGLGNLVKLYLDYNFFPFIEGHIFENLAALKKLYVNSDYLICNCRMKDFINWYRSSQKLKVIGRCELPVDKRNSTLRKISKDNSSLNCDHPTTLPLFDVQPHQNQIVFSGDKLTLSCEGTNLDPSEVVWSFNKTHINSSIDSVNEYTAVDDNRTTIASLLSVNLTSAWSGNWKCTIKSNHSYDSRSVNLFVIDEHTAYCDPDQVNDDYGLFNWQQAVVGATLSLNCPVPIENKNITAKASRTCLSGGTWSSADYSLCQYVDNVARILKNCSNVDAVNSCSNTPKSLIKFKVSSLIGLELLTCFMKDCVQYLSNASIGDQLIDMASLSMTSPSTVAIAAQNLFHVFDTVNDVISRAVIHKLSFNLSVYNQNSSNFAVMAAYQANKSADNLYKCFVNISEKLTWISCNQTGNYMKLTQASVFVPLQHCMCSSVKILIYRNHFLFQPTDQRLLVNSVEYYEMSNLNSNSSSGFLVIVSPVYSILALNGTRAECNQAIILVFNTSESVNSRTKQYYIAVWFEDDWHRVREECELAGSGVKYDLNISVVKCHKMGTYAIFKDTEYKEDNIFYPDHNLLYPIVYVSSSLLCVSLVILMLSYFILPQLVISRDARHIFINVLLHLLIATLSYVIGVKRTDLEILCYSSGVLLHYSSLAVLVWLLLTSRNMSKEMVLSHQQDSCEPRPKRPILRFYLLACGVPVIICGITAAAKIENYHDSNREYCWLSWDTSIYAFYVPAGLTAISCLLVLLRVLATLSSNTDDLTNHSTNSPARVLANENTPLHHHPSSNRHSISSINKQILNEQDFSVRLRGTGVTLFLYALTWTFAALIVAAPNIKSPTTTSSDEQYYLNIDSDQNEDSALAMVFSWLYAFSSLTTGIFLIYQHLISRNDVKKGWKCALNFRKQKHPADTLLRGGDMELTSKNKNSKQKNVSASGTEEMTLETMILSTPGEETPQPTSSINPRVRKESVNNNSSSIIFIDPKKCSGTLLVPVLDKVKDSSIHVSELPCHANNKNHIKLTNVQNAVIESSITEHSFDESNLIMHTVPITWKHSGKLSNAMVNNRCRKIRKNLEARRKRKQKLSVLREYAQDPLTSNDEGEAGRKVVDHETDGSRFLDQDKVDEKMMENLAIKEYQKADAQEKLATSAYKEPNLRPLLISSSRKKKDSRNAQHFCDQEKPDPNLASNYRKNSSCLNVSYCRNRSSQDSAHSLTNRTDGVENHSRPEVSISGIEKTHNYLTASTFLSNPLNILLKHSGTAGPGYLTKPSSSLEAATVFPKFTRENMMERDDTKDKCNTAA